MPRYLIRTLLVGSAGAGLLLYGYQQHQNNEKNSLFTTVDEIYQSGLRKWDEFRQPTTTTTTTSVTSNESLLVVEQPPVIQSEKLSKQENESTVETNKTSSRPSDPARALLFDDKGRIKRSENKYDDNDDDHLYNINNNNNNNQTESDGGETDFASSHYQQQQHTSHSVIIPAVNALNKTIVPAIREPNGRVLVVTPTSTSTTKKTSRSSTGKMKNRSMISVHVVEEEHENDIDEGDEDDNHVDEMGVPRDYIDNVTDRLVLKNNNHHSEIVNVVDHVDDNDDRYQLFRQYTDAIEREASSSRNRKFNGRRRIGMNGYFCCFCRGCDTCWRYLFVCLIDSWNWLSSQFHCCASSESEGLSYMRDDLLLGNGGGVGDQHLQEMGAGGPVVSSVVGSDAKMSNRRGRYSRLNNMISCHWFFDRTNFVLSTLVSREPYLAFLHSIISLPISIFLFIAVFSLLSVGGFFYCICGVGILLLAAMSGMLRLMTFVEIMLARHLLCMKDTLSYPVIIQPTVDWVVGTIYTLDCLGRLKKKRNKKKKQRKKQQHVSNEHHQPNNNSSNNTDGSEEYVSSANMSVHSRPPKHATTNHHMSSSSAEKNYRSFGYEAVADETSHASYIISPKVYHSYQSNIPHHQNESVQGSRSRRTTNNSTATVKKLASVNSNEDSIAISVNLIPYEDSDDSDDYSSESEAEDFVFHSDSYARRSFGSPDETNHYYYQQYGTMMSRSLDTGSPHSYAHPSSMVDSLMFSNDSIARSPIKRPPSRRPKKSKSRSKSKRKSSVKDITNQPQRSRSNTDGSSTPLPQNYGAIARAATPGPQSTVATPKKKSSLRSIGTQLSNYVFDSHVGFSLLYVVVKLPISMLTFVVSIFLVGFPLLLISIPLLHIACKQIKHMNMFCAVLMAPDQFHFGWLPFVSWTFGLVRNDIGNVLACLIGFSILPICVFLLVPVTRMAKDAITLIGEDAELYSLDDN